MNIKKLSFILLSITFLNSAHGADFKLNLSADELDDELTTITKTIEGDDEGIRSASRAFSSLSVSSGGETPLVFKTRSGRTSGGTTSVIHGERIQKRKELQARSAAIHAARKTERAEKMPEDPRPSSPIIRKRDHADSPLEENKKPALASEVKQPSFKQQVKQDLMELETHGL